MRMRDKIKVLTAKNFHLEKHINFVGKAIWDLKSRLERQGVCPYDSLSGNEESPFIKSFEELKQNVLRLPE